MNNPSTMHHAEHVDRHIQFYAGIAFLMAIKFSISAAMTVVPEPTRAILDTAELVIALFAVVGVLALVPLHWKNLPPQTRREYLKGEGFVPEAFRLAAMQAFFFSFLFITVLEVFSKKMSLTQVPAFYLNVSLAFMLFTLTILFFVRLRAE